MDKRSNNKKSNKNELDKEKLNTSSNSDDLDSSQEEGNNPSCVVCFRKVKIYSIGECDHAVCHECSIRMRVLCSRTDCPICRINMSVVSFILSNINL